MLRKEREPQFRQLEKLLTRGKDFIPLIVVYGYIATGKTTTVQLALRECESLFAYVNCLEVATATDLYQNILRNVETRLSFEQSSTRVTNHYVHFIKRLKAASDARENAQPIYIVLDNVEKLIETGLVEVILNLNNQMHFDLEISVVVITNGLSRTFSRMISPHVPVYVHFPLFRDETIISVLQETGQTEVQKLSNQWIAYVYKLLKQECNVWTEIQYVIQKLQPVFNEFVEKEENLDNCFRKLVRFASPYIAVMLGHLFQHNLQFDQLKKCVEKGEFKRERMDNVQWTSRDLQQQQQLQLPQRTLCLIVASYIASFTPSSTDVMHFTTQKNKAKKQRRNGVDREASIPQRLIGPTSFQLSRLLALYHSLLESCEHDEEDASDETTFAQITMLLRMQLLTRISPRSELDDIQYRCNADLEYVELAAKRLGIDLMKYVPDH